MQNKIQNVMLIDDEEIDQKQYRRVMSRSGIVENIIAFSYADEAFEYLRDNADLVIDLILLDINMPRMDGFQFLEKVSTELNRNVAHVVIIMLTTSLDPRDRERASRMELVRDFINKPLEETHIRHAAQLVAESKGQLDT